jgi:hypothetical protein
MDMGRIHRDWPMFAREQTAAKILDMTCTEFRTLVECGSLPKPTAHNRWDVAALEAIMRGEKIKPAEDFDL